MEYPAVAHGDHTFKHQKDYDEVEYRIMKAVRVVQRLAPVLKAYDQCTILINMEMTAGMCIRLHKEQFSKEEKKQTSVEEAQEYLEMEIARSGF